LHVHEPPCHAPLRPASQPASRARAATLNRFNVVSSQWAHPGIASCCYLGGPAASAIRPRDQGQPPSMAIDAPASRCLPRTIQSIYLPEFSSPLRNMLSADPFPSSLSIITDTSRQTSPLEFVFPSATRRGACLVLQNGISQGQLRGPCPALADRGSFRSAADATKYGPGGLAVSGLLD